MSCSLANPGVHNLPFQQLPFSLAQTNVMQHFFGRIHRRWKSYVKDSDEKHISAAVLEKLTGLTFHRSSFATILRSLAEKRPELILATFELAKDSRFQLREADFTIGISACGRSKLWQHACVLLDAMHGPSVIPYSAAISACEKNGQWQQALGLFEAMHRSRVTPDAISYSASISACEKAGRWEEALNLFGKMHQHGAARDVYSFSAAISACEKGGQWQQALSLFEAMPAAKVDPNVVSYSAAISAFEKGGQWQQALSLFERMPTARILPSVVSHSAVVGACEKGSQWEHALMLFEVMPEAKVLPNAVSYSAAISACRQGGQWQQALNFFATMPLAKVSPNIISYNATISACLRNDAWQQAMSLFKSMPALQVEPDSATYNEILDSVPDPEVFQQGLPCLIDRMPSPPRAQYIDLHGLSEGAACFTLRWWLASLVAPTLANSTGPLRCVIVTGYGRSRGWVQSSDLRRGSLELLQGLELEAHILPNRGRIGLVLSSKDLPRLQNKPWSWPHIQVQMRSFLILKCSVYYSILYIYIFFLNMFNRNCITCWFPVGLGCVFLVISSCSQLRCGWSPTFPV